MRWPEGVFSITPIKQNPEGLWLVRMGNIKFLFPNIQGMEAGKPLNLRYDRQKDQLLLQNITSKLNFSQDNGVGLVNPLLRTPTENRILHIQRKYPQDEEKKGWAEELEKRSLGDVDGLWEILAGVSFSDEFSQKPEDSEQEGYPDNQDIETESEVILGISLFNFTETDENERWIVLPVSGVSESGDYTGNARFLWNEKIGVIQKVHVSVTVLNKKVDLSFKKDEKGRWYRYIPPRGDNFGSGSKPKRVDITF